MKLIYCCHDCGLVAELDSNTTTVEPIPIGWVKREHVDGTYYWTCTNCAARKGVKRGAVYCDTCHKRVSNEVVDELIVRATVICPECFKDIQPKSPKGFTASEFQRTDA